jgi:glyoxylase-like metal-dependent hydrolase (beta-lactamase superfamily II)
MSFHPITLGAHNPGPMTGSGNNTYLLVGPDGDAALIDAGVGEPRHLAAVRHELDDRGSRLSTVLITHGHPDHVAGAPALAAAHPGASFYKHPWPEEDGNYAVPWKSIEDGDDLPAGGESLIALHTAGHSPDHVVFWHEASRTAFTGDLVIAGASVVIDTRGGDLGAYLVALERLLALSPLILLPAHGPEVSDPSSVLSDHLEHRRLRERQVLAALAAGCATVQEIADSIYDGLNPALMPAAAENVRAHLQKLKREGRANEEDAQWRLWKA